MKLEGSEKASHRRQQEGRRNLHQICPGRHAQHLPDRLLHHPRLRLRRTLLLHRLPDLNLAPSASSRPSSWPTPAAPGTTPRKSSKSNSARREPTCTPPPSSATPSATPSKTPRSVAMNPIIKFTTLFGLLAVELAVTIDSSTNILARRRLLPDRALPSSTAPSTACASAAGRQPRSRPRQPHPAATPSRRELIDGWGLNSPSLRPERRLEKSVEFSCLRISQQQSTALSRFDASGRHHLRPCGANNIRISLTTTIFASHGKEDSVDFTFASGLLQYIYFNGMAHIPL